MQRLLAILLAVAFPSAALADYTAFGLTAEFNGGAVEICGSGLDENNDNATPCGAGEAEAVVGTGCDTLCSSKADADRDGYVSANDCDDTNPLIFEGYERSCGTDGWQVCQADGTWTTCSETERCGATGSGTCYYIDFSGSGCGGGGCSDSNDGLTRATAWSTPLNIVSDHATAANPTALSAGDAIYVLGSGTLTHRYSSTSNGTQSWFFYNQDGTAANPITLKPYPGYWHDIELDSDGVATSTSVRTIYLFFSDYWEIEGFKITGAYNKGVNCIESDNFLFRRNFVYENRGVEDQNMGGVDFAACENGVISHNFIWDNYDSNANEQNNHQINFFGGTGNRVAWNRLFNSDAARSSMTSGKCVKYKHAESSVSATTEWDHNILINCSGGKFETAQANSHIHHNLIVDGGGDAVYLSDLGGPYYPVGLDVEYNTFMGQRGLELLFQNQNDATPADLSFQNNVVLDDYASEYSGAGTTMLRLDHYGTDADYATLVTGNELTINNNCYYNPNQEFEASLWGNNDAGRTAGAEYETFAAWQAFSTSRFDADSYQEDPALDAEQEATSSNCTGKGWVLSDGGGDPPTTTTTTTTTSTTTTTTVTTTTMAPGGRTWGGMSVLIQ